MNRKLLKARQRKSGIILDIITRKRLKEYFKNAFNEYFDEIVKHEEDKWL